jgi:hypothetical protein
MPRRFFCHWLRVPLGFASVIGANPTRGWRGDSPRVGSSFCTLHSQLLCGYLLVALEARPLLSLEGTV